MLKIGNFANVGFAAVPGRSFGGERPGKLLTESARSSH
jgi:hypothetical protein